MRYSSLSFVLAILSLMIFSCKKGSLPEAQYFGKLEMTLLSLPNTPDVDVYFSGNKLGVMQAANNEIYEFDLIVSEGKLEYFKAGTQELLADTTITIIPSRKVTFKYAYSPDLGLSGFIAGGAVPADSIAGQFLNSVSDYYDQYPSYDLEIWIYNLETLEFLPTGKVIPEFQNVKLSAERFTLDYATPDGSPYFYYIKLKDNATGEYIIQPSTGWDYAVIPPANGPGSAHIYKIEDAGGDISISDIPL